MLLKLPLTNDRLRGPSIVWDLFFLDRWSLRSRGGNHLESKRRGGCNGGSCAGKIMGSCASQKQNPVKSLKEGGLKIGCEKTCRKWPCFWRNWSLMIDRKEIWVDEATPGLSNPWLFGMAIFWITSKCYVCMERSSVISECNPIGVRVLVVNGIANRRSSPTHTASP